MSSGRHVFSGTVPRTLVIVSKDYGELLLAMMFLHGQQIAGGAALLLPPQLHAANAASLGVAVYSFSSLGDVIRVVDAWRPKAVILASGYLFSNNKLLSRGDLRRAVEHVRGAGSEVLTTDPFMGMAESLSRDDIRLEVPDDTDLDPALMRTAEQQIAHDLREVAEILQAVTHLYVMPADLLSPSVRRLSFFNPGLSSMSAPAADEARWFFVIGSHDLAYQQLRTGVDAFARLLAARLEQAACFGARPSIMAPPSLLDQLSALLPSSASVELLRFCPHDAYVSRLLDAQYVFTWNLFSASIMVRIDSMRPCFFFDRGHLSRLIPRAYPLGLRLFMSGWEPCYLTLSATFDPEHLASDAAAQTRQFETITARWRQSPQPDDVIGALIR